MKYFGTDGIRGRYNDVITNELAFKLGRSLNTTKVVVGYDTRESSEVLVKYLINGCISKGIEVINAGVVPTPALIYYSKMNNIYGVMITASHNPYYDNGLKVVNSGIKLNQNEELLIEKELNQNVLITYYDNVCIDESVINLYYKLINNYTLKTNLNVVIDCANGATYKTAPFILKDVCNLKVISSNPNGKNINDNVGSTYINNIKMNMNDHDIGFSFDGDGDRIIAVENNKIIDGDQIIYIIASYLKDNNVLNNNTIVLTKMSNIGILKRLDELDINYVLTDVGDKYVVEQLLKNNYSIGGENSGHIILPDILSTGDGLLVCLLLLKIMKEYNTTLTDLLSSISMYEDKMINLKVINKNIIYNDYIVNKINEINNNIDGKVIVRQSGTEDLIRISVMAKTKNEVKKYLDELVNLIGE